MATLERRSLEMEFRAPSAEDGGLEQDGLPRQFWARVVNWNVLDSYRTRFREGCFTGTLQRRLPRLMYGHGGWENPHALIGKGVEYRTVGGQDGGLEIKFELDDFNFVPTARQVAHQLVNGTLDRFSVGFMRKRDSRAPQAMGGGTWIEEAELMEVSVLPEGSVPGTRLLSFRAPGEEDEDVGPHVIAVDDAVRILTRYSLGELGLAEALQAVISESTASLTDEELNEEGDGEDEDEGDGGDGSGAADGSDGDGGDQADASGDEGDQEGGAVEPPYVDEEADAILAELEPILTGRSPVVEVRKDFTAGKRESLAKQGKAMPGGGFPIESEQDLRNAIQAIGRSKDPEMARAHIIKRAKALGLTKLLPEDWLK